MEKSIKLSHAAIRKHDQFRYEIERCENEMIDDEGLTPWSLDAGFAYLFGTDRDIRCPEIARFSF